MLNLKKLEGNTSVEDDYDGDDDYTRDAKTQYLKNRNF